MQFPTGWRLPRPLPLDIVWAAFIALLALMVPVYGLDVLPGIGSLVWGAMFVVPILWRRADADLAALAIIPAHLIQLVLLDSPLPVNLAVPLMMFTVAAHGRLTYRLWWLGAGGVAALLAALDWTFGQQASTSPGTYLAEVVIGFVGLASIVAASWALGAFVRARTEASRAARDAVVAQQQQHAQAIVLTATQERQRLAREMHDVVAHSLAVIVVQADGGAYAASVEGDPLQRLAMAEKALATIRTTASDALTETRRLVGVLRADQGMEMAPASGLGDIYGLVQGLAEAGRDVRMQVTGDPELRWLLSPGLELAVFRIVQEALTNAVKHAGEDASVLVLLHHAPEGLTVTVRDTGHGAGPSDGLGHGLVGMRERVSAFGGTLAAHDHPDGGFVVTAFLPTDQGAHP